MPDSPTRRGVEAAAGHAQFEWSKTEARPLDLNGPRPLPHQRRGTLDVGRPCFDQFADVAAEFGERIACESIDSRLTFAETWAACRRLAATIHDRVPPGRPVGVLLPNGASFPVAVLACLGTARPCVMIDRHYPPDHVAAIVRDAGLAAVVLERSDIDEGYLLPAGVLALAIDDVLGAGPAPTGVPVTLAPIEAPSFIVYTSGSTGRPKGIVLSQRSVLHRAAELAASVHLGPGDKVLSLASPGTIAGLQQIFEVMLSGATLVKFDLQRVGLGRVVDAIGDRGITMMFSTPAVWRSVAGLEGVRQRLASLRCIQSSGDTLLRIDLELMRAVLPPSCAALSVYGATEAPALLQWFVTAQPPDDESRVPAGYPLPDCDFALIDDQGQPVADGEPGELVIRSAFTALGLWVDGAVSDGPLVRDAAVPKRKIYRTGDLVRRRPDGLHVVLGRKDRQIKIRGNRVELAEIETALRRIPSVLNAAVVARRIGVEPTVLAFVVPREPGRASFTSEVRAHLVRTLPSYMQPSRLFVLDDLPLLPGRKVDDDALLAHAAGQEAAAPKPSAPFASTQSVEMVRVAWRKTLGRQSSIDDRSFEDAGGDSLSLMQMVFRLERMAGVALPMERFHGRLTVEEFAAELDRCLHNASRPAADVSVFLFPPGAGVGAGLAAAIRAASAERIELRQVSYPDARALCARDASFETVVSHAARRIAQAQPLGPLMLVGYSNGGDIAYAVARQLLAEGRDVALLAILDTDVTGMRYPQTPAARLTLAQELERLLRFPFRRDRLRLLIGQLPATMFARRDVRWLVRLLLSARFPLSANAKFLISFRAMNELFDHHCCQWLARVAFSPLPIPTVLFRSAEARPGAPLDLGWLTRTASLKIVGVAGDHWTMFDGERAGLLMVQLARYVRDAASKGALAASERVTGAE